MKTIKELIIAKTDVNFENKGGYPPLDSAFFNKVNPDIIKELLNAGAKSHSLTSLHKAIDIGDLDIIQALLNAGADPNHRIHFPPPLDKAIGKENLDIVNALLDAGADPNHIRYVPLHRAIDKRNLDIVKALLDAGADVAIKDSRGSTPLESATQQRNTKLIEAIKSAIEKRNVAEKLTNDQSNDFQSIAIDSKSFMEEILEDKKFVQEITQPQKHLQSTMEVNLDHQDYSSLDNVVKKSESSSPFNTASDLIQKVESSEQFSQSNAKGKELAQLKPENKFTKAVSVADNAALARVVTKLARNMRPHSTTSKAISKATPKAPRGR